MTRTAGGRGRLVLPIPVLVGALLLAGCFAAPDPAGVVGDAPGTGSGPEVPLPPIEAVSFAPPALVTTISGMIAQEEPLLHTASDGTVLLSLPHVPALFASTDGGATFSTRFDVRTGEGDGTANHGRTDGAFANGDGDALHWLGLFGTDHDLPFQTSTDGGLRWSPAIELAETAQVDRQWVGALPGGRLVATWSQSGLAVRTSADGGATWTPTAKVVPSSALAGPVLAIPETGTFAIPFNSREDGGRVVVAQSSDGGATWTRTAATPPLTQGAPAGGFGPVTVAVPVLARDAGGVLYLAYASDDPAPLPANPGKPVVGAAVFLARSFDGGATWAEPLRVSLPGRNAVLPWVVAGAEGRIAVGFYESLTGVTREVPSAWSAVLAASMDADAPPTGPGPSFVRAEAGGGLSHVGTTCNECGDFSRLDHLGLTVDAHGVPVFAYLADGQANPRDLDVMVARAEGVVLDRPRPPGAAPEAP